MEPEYELNPTISRVANFIKLAAFDPLVEAVQAAMRGQTPFVRPEDVAAENARRAAMGIDTTVPPSNPLADVLQGKTPFVTEKDVQKEKKRRAGMGLDPDFYTNPFEDLGLITPTASTKKERDARIKAVITSKPVTNTPVVQPQEEAPAPAPEPAARNYEKEAFERFKKGNNPALESGAFTPEYLFELNKKHQAFKLNRQGKTSADLSPENAYLAAYLDARQK